jgi:DNA polymerase-1
MTETPETLYLVDGSGFIFRAYHALPPLNRPDGTPVNAVLGFVNMMVRLLKDKHAHQVAVIFDAARKNFRNDIYPEYKAHRPPPPEDLVPQFPLIRAATRAFALPAIEQEGFEADDLIATYTVHATRAGMRVVIVSSDKDLMQLVGDNVVMMDPIKQTILGVDAVLEKFGVPPERVVDVQALCGDAVDNVPGVPGIGIKTAATLINEFGTLEALLANAVSIKQDKRRETLLAHGDEARLSYQLVCLRRDVPLDVPLDDLVVRDLTMPDLPTFLNEQGFKSVLARLGSTSAPPAHTPAPDAHNMPGPAPVLPGPGDAALLQPMDHTHYQIITTIAALHDFIAGARATGFLAIDTETTHLTPAKADVVGISLATAPGVAAYIPLGHRRPADLLADPDAAPLDQLPIADVVAALQPTLQDPSILKIGHNIKYDLQILAGIGLVMHPLADTMLLSYALDNTAHGHGLEELGQVILGFSSISYDAVTGTGKNRLTFDLVPIDLAAPYAAEDADLTLRLYHALSPRLTSARAHHIYHDLDMGIVPVIAQMEQIGIKVDLALLSRLSNDFGGQLQALETTIIGLAGRPFNINSPKQMGTLLFDELGLVGSSRTKTGDWSTSADILEDLADQGHVIVAKILEYRALAKLKSTYTDALAAEINPRTGRMHTSYGLALTSTGRLSSSDPNLQNIPIRTENGRAIRRAFITDPGWSVISVDYSQIELRLVAEIAGIAALKQAFIDGHDIHAITASQVFGVPLEGMDPMIRRQAKAINFGIIYGMSGFGLARQLGIEPSVANGYIRAYFDRFPELKEYFEATKEYARAHGVVHTAFGRRIVIDGIRDKNAARRAGAERQAINAPIQGTAADLMKAAMQRVPQALKEAGLDARLLLQVHDELVLEAPQDQAQATGQLVKRVMEQASPFSLPIIASFGIGPNWDDAH